MKKAIILSLIIFSVCLAYSFCLQIEPGGDARDYDTIALNITEGRGFILELEGSGDIVRFAQFYTAFLALIYKIFGHHYAIVWVFQALLHALTCLFLFFICLNIFTPHLLGKGARAEKVGLIAMGLYGFWPDLVESTGMLMTEILFLFLVALIVYLIIKFFQNPNIKKATIISLIVSIAVYVRPTILLFSLVFAIVIFFTPHLSRGNRKTSLGYEEKGAGFKKGFTPQKTKGFCAGLEKKYIYLVIFLIIPIIAMGFWMFRNYLKYDRFVFTTAGGYDLWVGNNPQANGELEISEEIKNYVGKYGFVNIDKKGISEVKKFAIEQPFQFFKLQLIKTSKYFSLIRPIGWWWHLNKIEKSLTLLFSGLFGAVGFVFGISGAWKILKEKNFFSKLLVYLAICGPIAVIPIVVGTRYRYQIYPFLAIFAAYFLVMFFLKKSSGLYKILLVIFIIFFLNSVYDLIANLDVFLEHLHRII